MDQSGADRCFFTCTSRLSGNGMDVLGEKEPEFSYAGAHFFHLVEAKREEEGPFAFLATYSTLDSEGLVKHLPLSCALEEYKDDREKLLEQMQEYEGSLSLLEVMKLSAGLNEAEPVDIDGGVEISNGK